MPTQAYALFPTPIGHCGVAWSERGLTGVQLPEQDEAATRARMGRRFPQCSEALAPPQVQEAIRAVVALLGGAPQAPVDLSNVVLDMDGVPPFHQRVYELARRLLPGETVTYGEMARRLGDPGAARAVGQALGSNPFAPVVPCVTVCSPLTGVRAASLPMAVSQPSCVCCSLSVPSSTGRVCLTTRWMRGCPKLADGKFSLLIQELLTHSTRGLEVKNI